MMQDAIVEPMPDNSDVARDSNSTKGLWQVVIVEKNETGEVIQNSPNNVVYRTDLSHEQAISVANQFVQELRKAREENQNK
jgi:hypothetical protein